MAIRKFTILVTLLLAASISDAQVHRCFISDSIYPIKLLIEIEPVKTKKGDSPSTSIVRIYNSENEIRTNKILLNQDAISDSVIKELDRCVIAKRGIRDGESIGIGDHKYIFILDNFYSSESGRTFKSVSAFENDIRKQYKTGAFLGACFFDDFVFCGNAAEAVGPHDFYNPTLELIFRNPKNDGTNDEFESNNNGMTWNYSHRILNYRQLNPYYGDRLPEFNGDLKKYIEENLQYPSNSKKGMLFIPINILQ